MDLKEVRQEIFDLCSYAQFELRNAPGFSMHLIYTSTWLDLQVRVYQVIQGIRVDLNLISLDTGVYLNGIGIELWRQIPAPCGENLVGTIFLRPRWAEGQPGLPCVGESVAFEGDQRINEIIGHYRLRPTTRIGNWLLD